MNYFQHARLKSAENIGFLEDFHGDGGLAKRDA